MLGITKNPKKTEIGKLEKINVSAKILSSEEKKRNSYLKDRKICKDQAT
jgi:hypothetical protein